MFDAERAAEVLNHLHNQLGEILVPDYFRHLPYMFLFFAGLILLAWGVEAFALRRDRIGLMIVSVCFLASVAVAAAT